MQANSLSRRDFRLGDWVIRPHLSRIERDGVAVHVAPRAMAVLVHLAEAGGAVLSRNAVLDAVWPRMTVTPDALARCLVELRKAFGDRADGTRVIETIPKVGLRLTLPVHTVGDCESAVASRPSPSVGTGARRGALVAASIAVAAIVSGALWWSLSQDREPARGQSSNPDARAFYASALEYSKRPNRLEALRHQEELYVRATEADPKFALAWARLGHTHTGAYWYGLDRSPARLAAAERALRRALALDYDLPEVHLYLGEFYFKGRDDVRAALAELAMAERGMSDRPDAELFFLRSSVDRHAGAWALAAADGERAVELDAANLVYRRQLHITYVFMRDYARAERVLDDISNLFPDDGTTYVDRAALAMQLHGDTSLADRYESRSPSPLYDEGLAYAYTRWLAAILDRDYERALRVLAAADTDVIFNGDLRNSMIPRSALVARTHRLAGDGAAQNEFALVAREAEGQLAAREGADSATRSALLVTLAEARMALGQRAEALASARSAVALVPKAADALLGSATQLAVVVRVLVPGGETDAALRELDDYLGQAGHWSIEGLRADPQLEPLFSDPRSAALIAKYLRTNEVLAGGPGA